jgi:hypothetical protein
MADPLTRYRFGVVLIDNDGEVLISLGHIYGARSPALWLSCGWPANPESFMEVLEDRPSEYNINRGHRYQVQKETL